MASSSEPGPDCTCARSGQSMTFEPGNADCACCLDEHLDREMRKIQEKEEEKAGLRHSRRIGGSSGGPKYGSYRYSSTDNSMKELLLGN